MINPSDKVFVNCASPEAPECAYRGPGVFVRYIPKDDPTWRLTIEHNKVDLVEVAIDNQEEPGVFEACEVSKLEEQPAQPITQQDVLNLILNLVRLPTPSVCRHLVALDLLNLLETHNIPFNPKLAQLLSQGSEGDQEVESLLTTQRNNP